MGVSQIRPVINEHEIALAEPSTMTESSPSLGDHDNRQNAETESESGPELVKVEPRPEEDSPSPVAQQELESSDDSGEGDEIAEADDSDDDDETDDEDDEPKLKYARLTQHLNAVYRADMTSAFIVAGDKMLIGTHGGNIVSYIACALHSTKR